MKERYIILGLIVTSLILFIFTLRGIYGNPAGTSVKNNLDQVTKPFELSPERGRYLLVLSLGENGTFSLSQELAEAAYPDVGYYKGKFYIFFAPGVSILALPFYHIGKIFNIAQVATYFLISLFAAATIAFLYVICRQIFKLPIWASIVAPLIFGFASTSWGYATTLYQHHITTFCIIASLYAVWRFKQGTRLSWLWGLFVWFNYAMAIGVDYPNVMLMLPVMVYFLISAFKMENKGKNTTITFRLSIIATSIIFVVISLLHGYFNYVHFGSPTRVSNAILGYKRIKEEKILDKKDPEKIIAELEKNKVPVRFFREYNMPRGMAILLVGIDKGIALFSPIYLLAIFGIYYAIRKMNMEKGILLACVVTNLFLYSSFGDPWGGWAFGPRYLIPSMAVLSIFIAYWLQKVQGQIIAGLITFILFAYSSAVALLGALTTNAVPPKVEADYLKMKYNFLYNWDYLMDGRSSSFVYNTFFSSRVTLMQYFAYIYIFVMVIAYIILFVVPYWQKLQSSSRAVSGGVEGSKTTDSNKK